MILPYNWRALHHPITFILFNPTRRGLWNGHQGAFNARPYKNQFKGPFGPIFLHRKGWGIKITSEKFFEIGF